jgi:hypothetical protein
MAMRPADQMVEAVWADVLCAMGAFATGDAPPQTVMWLDASQTATVLARCNEVRLVGLFGAAVTDGAIAIAGEAGEEHRSLGSGWKVHDLAVERTLLDVAASLDRAGIEMRVLKGAATAHLDHRSPSHRDLGDLDILIPANAVEDALATLLTSGMVLSEPVPWNRWDMEHALTLRSPGGIEVDMHHRLARRTPGLWAEGLGLWDDPDEFTLRSATLRALPRRLRLAHAAMHYATSPGRLRRYSSLLDVLVLGKDRATVDDAFVASSQVGLDGLVEAGLDAAQACFHSAIERPGSAVRSTGASRRGRLARWAYPADNRSLPREELLYVVSRGLPQRLADYGALTWPPRSYLAEAGQSRRSYMAALTRTLVGKRTGSA